MLQARTFVLGLSFALALSGCGEATSFSPGDPIGLEVHLALAPGVESYRCKFMRLPEAGGEIFVSGGSHHYSAGVHHYLLFRTSVAEIPAGLDGEVDCYADSAVMKYARGYVSGGQSPDVSADFPPGVAYPFESGELLLVQIHAQNTGAATLQADLSIEMRTTKAETVQQRAGTLRFYNPYIHVPARASATATMRCPISQPITILSAAPHMHKRGVDFQVAVDPAGERAASPFYRSTDWEQPDTFFGPLAVPAASHIRFRCGYANPGDTPFIQGLSADANEMCMWSAIYYPALPEAEEACLGQDQHGSGTASCAATTSCLERCPVASRPKFAEGSPESGECWQACITASCPNVTGALFPQLTCTDRLCKLECAQSGTACTSCVVARCAAEVDVCQRQACGD